MAGAAEDSRLSEAVDQHIPWKKWGPYLSERQWGTVREDYSPNGDAWSYFPHDQARSRAYRWGEDGLAGISDDHQQLCFALALWNGADSILKERLFGLSNVEGNHGEDVKEYYFYLDSTPTHSYMKYLYKYPQQAFPYADLVNANKDRSRSEQEYELLDTGIFNENRYFDVFVEYAKAAPEDIYIRISAYNRGPDEAELHLLPSAWFRNTWSGSQSSGQPNMSRISIKDTPCVAALHPQLGSYVFACRPLNSQPELLFTNNETNTERLFNTPNATPYVKDGFHQRVIAGQVDSVNPAGTGTKACAWYRLVIPAGEQRQVYLRLVDTDLLENSQNPFGNDPENIFSTRQQEADEFYAALYPLTADEDERRILRQALAGMLWSKQYYHFNLDIWLEEHDAHPLMGKSLKQVRNRDWFHMLNDDVISMPDKWEYPWFAAWDLAFHTAALNMVDQSFARGQLELMLNELYLHPSGQIPAYEWNFSDVNPPVHAWATLFNYTVSHRFSRARDFEFLKSAFQKLLLNFTWWVNRKDPYGENVFSGGFLGLDNIGVFDRSAPLPTGGRLEQADGTAWMALFSQNMLSIALRLAFHDASYEKMASKFFDHFLFIAAAMDRIGDNNDELWDEQDGFFYDVLRLPDGDAQRLKVRSIVGLLPLCAATTVPGEVVVRFPGLAAQATRRFDLLPTLVANIHDPRESGFADRRLFSVLNETKLRRVLAYLLSENEFLSQYGIRSLSRYHLEHPFLLAVHDQEYRVQYLPAESDSGLFGGNSNWRGPIWMPVNALIVSALLQYYLYYGDEFLVEFPTGSGNLLNLFQVAKQIAVRLANIFRRDEAGRRPVFGRAAKFQEDPLWQDHILFYEYFHGDNGAGLGASHQTGWTGLVARLLHFFHTMDETTYLMSLDMPAKPNESTSDPA